MEEARLILFDLDGVLIDTTSVLKYCYQEIACIAGVHIQSEEQLRTLVRLSPKTAIHQIFGVKGIDLSDAFDKLWRGQARLASPFPGIIDLLDQLSDCDVDLGIVTSRNKTDAMLLLRASGVLNRMRIVITWGNYRVAKPSPICILTALEQTGKRASQAIYVGDQDIDMRAARRAGVLAVGATWDQYACANELIEAGAHRIADKPVEILDFIE